MNYFRRSSTSSLLTRLVVAILLIIMMDIVNAASFETVTFQAHRDDITVDVMLGHAVSLHCLLPEISSDDNTDANSTTTHTVDWILPSSATVINTINKDTVSETREGPWIETKAAGVVVLHNCDQSLETTYICRDSLGNQGTVWLRVLTSTSFNTGEHFASGVIAFVVLIAIIGTSCGVYKCVDRRKGQDYSAGAVKKHTDFEIIIPRIEIIDENGDTVNQTVYDFV